MSAKRECYQKVTKHKIAENIDWSFSCFGCNDGPREGIGMRSFYTEDGYTVGICRAKKAHEGFPNTIHGGLVATYFDEVLWYATRREDRESSAMTAEMNVRYYAPIHIGDELRIVAEPARADGRHYYVDGHILLPDNKIAAECSLHYITLKTDRSLHKEENARDKRKNEVELEEIEF